MVASNAVCALPTHAIFLDANGTPLPGTPPSGDASSTPRSATIMSTFISVLYIPLTTGVRRRPLASPVTLAPYQPSAAASYTANATAPTRTPRLNSPAFPMDRGRALNPNSSPPSLITSSPTLSSSPSATEPFTSRPLRAIHMAAMPRRCSSRWTCLESNARLSKGGSWLVWPITTSVNAAP